MNELGELIASMVKQLWNGMSKVEADIAYTGVKLKVLAYRVGINYRIDIIHQDK